MQHTNLDIYKDSLSLLTDLYELTMAQGYWMLRMHQKEAVFHLFFRTSPYGLPGAIASGLETLVEYVKNFHFKDQDIHYLATLKTPKETPLFSSDFLAYLRELKLELDIDAVPEGTMVMPFEPIIRVKGPLLHCQILETAFLNLINFPTLISTKAAMIVQAAGGHPVLEFGLRRSQGIDGGLTAARSAFIGGCAGTSNLLAGKIYGMPVQGTMAHSWVMAFPNEQKAFDAYADVYPDGCLLLVDTYDTKTGIDHAIETAKKLKAKGQRLLGIRIDSGNLGQLSQIARQKLDQAGFTDATIFASNELDVQALKEARMTSNDTVTGWGIGTKLVTGGEQSALNGVYKLSAIKDDEGNWVYKQKQTEGQSKLTPPGILQTARFYESDVIFNEELGLSKKGLGFTIEGQPFNYPFDTPYETLLKPIFKKGNCITEKVDLKKIRLFAMEEAKKLEKPRTVGFDENIEIKD